MTKMGISEIKRQVKGTVILSQYLLHTGGKLCINFIHGSPFCTLSQDYYRDTGLSYLDSSLSLQQSFLMVSVFQMQFLGYIPRNTMVFLRLCSSMDVLFTQTQGSHHGSNHAQMASIILHLFHLVHGI